MEQRILRIARGKSLDIAARFSFQDRAAGGIARRFAQQRRRQHPGALDAREIAIMRGPAQVANAALRVAASQANEPREETRQRARPRQAVVVHAQPQIAIDAGGISREQAAIDVAHRLRVLRGAVAVAVLFALARAIAQRRRQPKIVGVTGPARSRVRTEQRGPEQRVDPP
ncbi:MAG: hypothetical protein ABR537_14170 [Gemmatimonadales bacterium]